MEHFFKFLSDLVQPLPMWGKSSVLLITLISASYFSLIYFDILENPFRPKIEIEKEIQKRPVIDDIKSLKDSLQEVIPSGVKNENAPKINVKNAKNVTIIGNQEGNISIENH